MVEAKLFVKSVRLPVVRYEMPNLSQGGHYCSAGYRTESTTISFSPEDEQAKKLLTRSGIKVEIVDLSDRGGWAIKLGVNHRGVKSTPTLIVGRASKRKYEGIRAISDYVSHRN